MDGQIRTVISLHPVDRYDERPCLVGLMFLYVQLQFDGGMFDGGMTSPTARSPPLILFGKTPVFLALSLSAHREVACARKLVLPGRTLNLF